jgi:hypothetical protein
MGSSDTAPTRKQLVTLRRLAMERGQSFATPRTRRQASAEIRRLLGTKRESASDQRRERLAISREMATGRGDAAAVRTEIEIEGYGSSATWARGAR